MTTLHVIAVPLIYAFLIYLVFVAGNKLLAGPADLKMCNQTNLRGCVGVRRLRFIFGFNRNTKRPIAPRLIETGALRRVA